MSGVAVEPDHQTGHILLMLGAGISILGDGAFLTGLAWSVLVITNSAVQLSTVMGSVSVVLILAAPFAGQILDWPRGPSWLAGSEYLAGLILLCAAAFLMVVEPTYGFFLVIGVLVSLFSSLSGPALPIMLARISSTEALPLVMARSQVAVRAGRIGGPLLGGVLVSVGDFRLACLVNAVSYLVSGTCWLIVRRRLTSRRPVGVTRDASRTNRVAAGLRYVWSDPYVRSLIVVALVANSAISFVTVTLALLVRGPLNGGSGTYGLMQATFQLGILGAMIRTCGWSSVR